MECPFVSLCESELLYIWTKQLCSHYIGVTLYTLVNIEMLPLAWDVLVLLAGLGFLHEKNAFFAFIVLGVKKLALCKYNFVTFI